MTLKLRRGTKAFLSGFKNVTFSLMWFPKQSLVYSSFKNTEAHKMILLFFCPVRNGSMCSGSCLSVGLICQTKCICYYVDKNTFIINVAVDLVMDWTYNTLPRTLCRCYLSKQPAIFFLCLLFIFTPPPLLIPPWIPLSLYEKLGLISH